MRHLRSRCFKLRGSAQRLDTERTAPDGSEVLKARGVKEGFRVSGFRGSGVWGFKGLGVQGFGGLRV